MIRINLECGQDIRSGFLNINSWPSLQQNQTLPEHTNFAIGDFRNLSPIVQNESVDQIIFNPSINILSPNDLVTVIQHWQSKLKTSGVLVVHWIDFKRVGLAAFKGDIGLQEIDSLVFGPNRMFQSIIDGSILQQMLTSINFNILSVNIADYHIIVEASKI